MMSPNANVRLRSATSGDATFIVEMTRHAYVIEDIYQRKGFRMVGQGRGPLGVAMHKDLRVRP